MKSMPLARAVDRFVQPGMHLNFASTPSRSNAAILAVARRFRGTRPDFVLSTTGFHSTAHLLAMLRLGRRYVACFFGDNYPTPRPNALYQTLLEEGAELQHWSLWSYVSALRAASFGEPYALTRPISGTTWGERLAEQGQYFEPMSLGSADERYGLLKPLVPDVTFLHAPLGDERGYAWFSPPCSEGFHGALAARLGVIVTVDTLVDGEVIEQHPELLPLPVHRVLAICEAPFGAHPQPVHFSPAHVGPLGYHDDYEHYTLWREMTTNPALASDFVSRVLDRDDAQAYREFVGEARLEALRAPAVPVERARPAPEAPMWSAVEPSERQLILAARAIVERVARAEHRSILAGIGVSFAAARLAKRLLEHTRVAGASEVELLVETGFAGFGERSPDGVDSFLLSRKNMLDSRRLTGVENVLGSLVRGSANRCLGVIGCAEVDLEGRVNSTFVGGRHLVGSGGAADIALGAREVIVLARADRLVSQVEYVTSPGQRVSVVVTESGVLERSPEGAWALTSYVAKDDASPTVPPRFSWPALDTQRRQLAPPPTAVEWGFVLELRSEAERRRRPSPREATQGVVLAASQGKSS